MKKAFVAIALLFVSGSCVTFFNKQNQVIDCCKAPDTKQCQSKEWKVWENKVYRKNWQCQCPSAKQDCGKVQQCQSKKELVASDFGKVQQCQSPRAKKEIAVPDCGKVQQCQSPCAKKEIAVPDFGKVQQCQSPCAKSTKNWQCQCPCGKKEVVVDQVKQCQHPVKK